MAGAKTEFMERLELFLKTKMLALSGLFMQNNQTYFPL